MELAQNIKWRGSTYELEKVEDGKVYWINPVSRHRDSCDIDSWKCNDPYSGRYS